MADPQDGISMAEFFQIIGEKETIIFQQQKTLMRLNRQVTELLQTVGELNGKLEQPKPE